MKILNFFYENPPEIKHIFERKIKLSSENLLIKGAKFSGKKSLILNYLKDFKSEDFLFLNFDDLRFEENCLKNLPKFMQENKIKIIIFYALPKSLNDEFITLLNEISKHAQIIMASEFSSLNFTNFKELYLDFLDFEEFMSLSKMPTNSQFGAFLQNGRSFMSDLNEYLKLNFSSLEREILGFIARNLGREFSVNELYQRLKNTLKISKDTLYKAVADLEDKGVICFLPHFCKRLKKVYFRDFALRNALCIDKNFEKIFSNAVFCELFKTREIMHYDKNFEFYLVNLKTAIFATPTLDVDLLKLRALKILPQASLKGISHIFFITLSNENSFYKDGVKVEIVPFEAWALFNY